MKATFTIYDPTTGKIECLYTCSLSVISERIGMFPGMEYLNEKADDLKDYIENRPEGPTIVPRPTMSASLDKAQILADGVEVVTITGPEGAEVQIGGPLSASATMDADGIAFTTDIPGTYQVKITLFPYLDWEGTIEAVEP